MLGLAGIDLRKDALTIARDCGEYVANELSKLEITGGRQRTLLNAAWARFACTVNLCESPIEKMMLAALAYLYIPDADCFPPAIHDVSSGEPWPKKPIVIVPQFVIARYRLDFLVQIDLLEKTWRFAIECDGIAGHAGIDDRQSDRERDAYLDALGIKTLRFSGQDIYRSQNSILSRKLLNLMHEAAMADEQKRIS
jgi:very-short-patch-repair endonuclease